MSKCIDSKAGYGDHPNGLSEPPPSQKERDKFVPWVSSFLVVVTVFAMLFMEKLPDKLDTAFMLALGYFFVQVRR